MTENTSITKQTRPPVGGLKKGILANKAEFDQHMANIDPKTVPNRLGLVIDDSGSMGSDGMDNAHKAVQEFTTNCNMKDTSIAIYPLNANCKPLVCDYDLVNLFVTSLQATGSTEIYRTLVKMITDEPITRAVLFSDGGPTDASLFGSERETSRDIYSWGTKPKQPALDAVKMYTDKEVPIDTIFIGTEGSSGYKEMEELARLTNGTFIHFKNTDSLRTGLKYLAPKYRALLANPEIKDRIQRGETI